MICASCGKPNDDSNSFCTVCGSALVLNNPTKREEFILKIINLILAGPIVFYLFRILLIIFGTLFLMLFGVVDYLNVDFKLEFLILTLITLFGILINVVIGIVMYKKNKRCLYFGNLKPINKFIYFFLTLSLGIFGINRFVIKDYKGGLLRLFIILGIPYISIIISFIINNDFLVVITFFISVSIAYGFCLSDLTIGLSKVSNNKKIYLT